MTTLKPLTLALCLTLVAFAVPRCGGSTETPPPSRFVVPVGDGTLVVATEGSLIAERPTNTSDRYRALRDYFRDHPDLFGPSNPMPDPPTFVQIGDEERVIGPGGERWMLVALHQTHMNAPVIDEMQMGSFLEDPDGDMLRRARGMVRDPSFLPMPPDPVASPPDLVLPVANDLIVQYGLSFDRTNIGDEPVISAKHDIAGYLVSQFRPTDTGSFERFQAIVDPRDLRTVVLEMQTACDAAPVAPDGLEVIETPDPPFIPPELLEIRSIRVHAVRLADLDGSNQAPITRQQVKKWVDAANEVWWPQADILFTFDDSPDSADFEDWRSTVLNTVPSNADEDYTYKNVGNIWSLMHHHRKLVVYFRARGGGGWSWGPTSTFFISMPSYTNTAINKPANGGWIRNDTAFSHEIGHYMGLAHPFGGTACAVAVPANSNGDLGGQDPNTVDDDVLDTNPDMRDGCYPTPSLTCAGGTVSWNGHTWDPPWANVMSYHDCLPEDLTLDQRNAIERTLLHPIRANLLD